MSQSYHDFLARKTHLGGVHGFEPLWLPDCLYPFQSYATSWAIRKGRGALFETCGLGKTVQQLVWAENVVRKKNRHTLVLTPLSVAAQTVKEAAKFGVEAVRSHRGELPRSPSIVVANYDRLHLFDPNDFAGVVLDESGCIKHYEADRSTAVMEFMRPVECRLLCSATPSPNDYVELGTSSEAIGNLGRMDMLSRFFTNRQGTNQHQRLFGQDAKWRFRGHAEIDFWRWVCSWARAIRRPSDVGCDDGPFVLPPLEIRNHIVSARMARPGFLFDPPAVRLDEQRSERKRTLERRCEMVATMLADRNVQAIAWCNTNPEGNLLTSLIHGAAQVKGSDSDASREEIFGAFVAGQVRVLVTKPSLAGFGLNFQHCARQTFFVSHSFEQYFQAVRRCWRFGQTRPVRVDVIASEGEEPVLRNLERKAEAADRMFDSLVHLMNDSLELPRGKAAGREVEVPTWLFSSKS